MVNFDSIANDPDNADKLNNDDNDYDDGKDENDDYEEVCGNGGGVGNNWSDDGCQDIIIMLTIIASYSLCSWYCFVHIRWLN